MEPGVGAVSVDLDRILGVVGRWGRYQAVQLILHIFSSFINSLPIYTVVFIGYQPPHQCSEVTNGSVLDPYLGDPSNASVVSAVYGQCSIDVVLNDSGILTSQSLPCMAGVNFSMPRETSFIVEWSLVCAESGVSELSQTALFAGRALGAVVFSALCDRWGRRGVYVTCTLAMTVCWAAASLVQSYTAFVVCAALTGFFQKGSAVAGYVMFTELVGLQWRCLASVCDSVLWSLGGVVMPTLAYFMQGYSWRYLNLLFASFGLYGLLMLCFLDESLRWLIATGRVEEARRILRKACRVNGKRFEDIEPLLMVREGVTDKDPKFTFNANLVNESPVPDPDSHGAQRASRGDDDIHVISGKRRQPSSSAARTYSMLDFLRHRTMFLYLAIVSNMWAVNNWAYFGVMLSSEHFVDNRFLNFGLLSIIDLPAVFVALCLLKRFGRKPLGIVFGLTAGTCYLLSVAVVYLAGTGVALTVATVALYVGKMSIVCSYVQLFVLYLEIFPTGMRSAASGLSATYADMANIVLPSILLLEQSVSWLPRVIFGCLLILVTLTLALVPETRHRRLPDSTEEIKAWKQAHSIDTADRNRPTA